VQGAARCLCWGCCCLGIMLVVGVVGVAVLCASGPLLGTSCLTHRLGLGWQQQQEEESMVGGELGEECGVCGVGCGVGGGGQRANGKELVTLARARLDALKGR
jgi:hypothetical protein